jgi:Flp pilus assembly protein CpaB
MRRSPRVLLAWSAALIVALTTARVVGGDLATLHRRASTLGPMHGVVVAVHDLALGQTITAGDVRRETRYATQIPREALADPRDAIGRVVIVPVLRHALLFAEHVAAAGRTARDAVVPRGDRAVHLVAKDGFRPPAGTIVDVLAAFDPTAVTVTGSTDEAVVVAAGAHVIAVDDNRTNGASNDANTGITVLVTESEARVIAFAVATADISFAVAPPESACCERAP